MEQSLAEQSRGDESVDGKGEKERRREEKREEEPQRRGKRSLSEEEEETTNVLHQGEGKNELKLTN